MNRRATHPPQANGAARRSGALRFSIGANVVLAIGVLALWWRAQESSPATTALPTRPTTHRATRADDLATELQPKPNGPKLTPAAVTELERLGISRNAIAEALINDHTYRHDQRVRELQKRYAPKPVPRREMLQVEREDEEGRTRELREALGEERFLAWDQDRIMRLVNMGGAKLGPDEADQMYRLQKDFEQKDRALRIAREDGVTDEADANAVYERNQQQLEQELEKLFGKDRLAQIRGTKPDPVADATRRFADLNPTPEQAYAAVQAEGGFRVSQEALIQRLKDNAIDPANAPAILKTLNDARDENLRQVFGADNYNAMKRQNDPTYQALQQYAGAWGLKDSDVPTVYNTLAAYQNQADLTRMAAELSEAAGQPVNWRQINAKIQQASQQTAVELANAIGGEAVRRLMNNGLLEQRGSEIRK